MRTRKTIKIKLVRVDTAESVVDGKGRHVGDKVTGTRYDIVRMTNAVVLSGSKTGLTVDFRVGDSLTEKEAQRINDFGGIEVSVAK